jgi:hypothetical protein
MCLLPVIRVPANPLQIPNLLVAGKDIKAFAVDIQARLFTVIHSNCIPAKSLEAARNVFRKCKTSISINCSVVVIIDQCELVELPMCCKRSCLI